MFARMVPLGAAVLVAGLLLPTPALADSTTQNIDTKCRMSYKHDRQRLYIVMNDREQPQYDAHENSVVQLIDEMRSLLADPGKHDLIPQQEQGTATFRDQMLTILADERDATLAEVKRFDRIYTKCVHTKADRKALNAGVGAVRSAFRDLYAGHEDLLQASGALTSADVGTATQKLDEARVEVLQVPDQFTRGMRTLRSLQ